MAFNKLILLAKDPQNWIYLIMALAVAGLSTGVLAQSANVYSAQSAQNSSQVMRAMVVQSREVKVEVTNTTRVGGATIGATLGGTLGAIVGKSNTARTGLGIIGAVLGGLGGQAAAETLGGVKAVEYIVQVQADSRGVSQIMAITQPEPGPTLGAGDQVLLIQTSGKWRVIRAELQVRSAVDPQQSLQAPVNALGGTPFYRQVTYEGNSY